MSDYDGILREDMNHKLDIILEGIGALSTVPSDIRQLKDDVAHIQIDVTTIKAVVTSQSTQLHNHETRITSLEQSVSK